MLKRISLHEITRNHNQPRQHFDQRALQDLAISIDENGLKQPITVRPIEPDEEGHTYMIVMGERRFRAHMILQEQGKVRDILCIVRKMDEDEMHIDAILENLQRVDVSPIEEAHAYNHAIQELGHTAETLAKTLGISQPWLIPNRLKLLGLTLDNQDLLSRGVISKKQALAMADLTPHGQSEFLKLVKQGLVNTNKSCEDAAARIAAKEAQTEIFTEAQAPKRDCTEAKVVEAKVDQIGKSMQALFDEEGFIICDGVQPHEANRCIEKIKLLKLTLGQIERELVRAASMTAVG